MASPWLSPPPKRPPGERPWLGLALLLSVPFLSLILIRMLWSGSTIWFLIAGVLMLGSAAVVFFSRRDVPAYGYQTLSPEPNRLPLWFLGLGALFFGLLIVPAMSSGSSAADRLLQSGSPTQASSNTATVRTAAVQQQLPRTQQPAAQPTAAPTTAPASTEPAANQEQAANTSPPAGSQTYVVQDGDTLWAIAQQFGVTVEDIVAANNLANDSDLQLGQQLIIPPSANATTNNGAGANSNAASEPQATPGQ